MSFIPAKKWSLIQPLAFTDLVAILLQFSLCWYSISCLHPHYASVISCPVFFYSFIFFQIPCTFQFFFFCWTNAFSPPPCPPLNLSPSLVCLVPLSLFVLTVSVFFICNYPAPAQFSAFLPSCLMLLFFFSLFDLFSFGLKFSFPSPPSVTFGDRHSLFSPFQLFSLTLFFLPFISVISTGFYHYYSQIWLFSVLPCLALCTLALDFPTSHSALIFFFFSFSHVFFFYMFFWQCLIFWFYSCWCPLLSLL